MDSEAAAVGEPEETDEVDGIIGEEFRSGNADAPVLKRESGTLHQLFVVAQMRRETVENRSGLCLHFFERGADDGGEVADIFCDQKIMLHEAFDISETAARSIAETRCQNALLIEAQDFFRAPRREMQVAAHPPQKFLAAAEQAIF